MNQLKWRNAKRILALALVAGIGAGAFRLAVRKQEDATVYTFSAAKNVPVIVLDAGHGEST